MEYPIVYRRNGKNVGEFDGKVLRKRVQADKHLFRVLNAWGIDAELLDKILVPKEAIIEITDTQKKIIYTISAIDARAHGQFYHFKDWQNRKDHGTQIFVPTTAFERKPI